METEQKTENKQNKQEKTMHIFLAPSYSWGIAAGTLIASVVKYASRKCHFHIITLSPATPAMEALTLAGIEQEGPKTDDYPPPVHEYSFHVFDSASLKDFKTCSRYTPETFIRDFIPYLFPEICCGVYMDCDLFIREDIAELSQVAGNLLNYHISAVYDFGEYKRSHYDANKHFNAGLLCMNLQRIRKDFPKDYLVELFLSAFALGMKNDESPLNWICQKKEMIFFRLSQRWNSYSFIRKEDSENRIKKALALGITQEEITEAVENPAVVHFVGDQKPWIMGKTTLPDKYLKEWKIVNSGVIQRRIEKQNKTK